MLSPCVVVGSQLRIPFDRFPLHVMQLVQLCMVHQLHQNLVELHQLHQNLVELSSWEKNK